MLSFSNFRMLNPEMADITRELLDEVYQRHSPFMSFMHTWMAFNGWMESVTGGGPDAVGSWCRTTGGCRPAPARPGLHLPTCRR